MRFKVSNRPTRSVKRTALHIAVDPRSRWMRMSHLVNKQDVLPPMTQRDGSQEHGCCFGACAMSEKPVEAFEHVSATIKLLLAVSLAAQQTARCA